MLSPPASDNTTTANDHETKTAPLQNYYNPGKNRNMSKSVTTIRTRNMKDRLRDDRRVPFPIGFDRPEHPGETPQYQTASQELQIFRRIHLQSTEDFLRTYASGDNYQTHFEYFDKQHVSEKYPQAEEWLTARLGRCITKRRGVLSDFSKAERARERLDISRLTSKVTKGGKSQRIGRWGPIDPRTHGDFLEPDWFVNGGLPPPHVQLSENKTCMLCSICFRQQQHLADNHAWRYANTSVFGHQI